MVRPGIPEARSHRFVGSSKVRLSNGLSVPARAFYHANLDCRANYTRLPAGPSSRPVGAAPKSFPHCADFYAMRAFSHAIDRHRRIRATHMVPGLRFYLRAAYTSGLLIDREIG